ncbi:MAG: cobaltochelatase subunit CobN [Chloroflexota bacterium]
MSVDAPALRPAASALPPDEADAYVLELAGRLQELEERLIPTGLHVLDQPFGPSELEDVLSVAAQFQPADVVAGLRSELRRCDEIDAVVCALDGRYLIPSSGGDVIRNPSAVPTGRNLHGLNPALVPTPVALRDAARTVDALLRRFEDEQGGCPESVGLVLWGTDNLKTDGEAIGQVFALLGARPLVDDLGRLHDVELRPLDELGRPRIDVVITASGIFRDIFAHHLALLDRAFALAAAADEPLERNFVRAHTLAASAELEVSLEEASPRIFSNAPGTYGANVNFAIENRAWQSEEELADIFRSRKGFVYGRKVEGRQAAQLFDRALSTVELTFQNVDSLEFGVTDIDHYNEYLGGLTRSVEQVRGKRPPAYLADFVVPNGKVRSVEEMVALETRTKTLNPRWYEGMLAHGFQGAREIETRVTNTFGWSATCKAVPDWIYDRVAETYVLDQDMLDRLRAANPDAATGLVGRLLEANGRGYWNADPSVIERLRDRYGELEDALEGV